MELTGKVALVTGASRGIGRGIAEVLAKSGMRLALNFHKNREAAAETQRLVKRLGAKALLVSADVGNEDQVGTMFQTVVQHFNRVDVLVNNAGVDSLCLPEALSLQEWNRILTVNLTGAFLCTRAALRIMKPQGQGRIVMISSIAGLRGTGNIHYVASKSGLLGLTMALARATAGSGITVNAVAPGLTRSDMLRASQSDIEKRIADEVPLGRVAEPEEVGRAVEFLIRHDYLTGETINLSGGRHIAL